MKKNLSAFCDEVKAKIPECAYVDDEILVVSGNPVEEITSTAEERECKVIVMGTAGAGGLVGVIMGSTARRVVRRSPIPVFILPRKEDN